MWANAHALIYLAGARSPASNIENKVGRATLCRARAEDQKGYEDVEFTWIISPQATALESGRYNLHLVLGLEDEQGEWGHYPLVRNPQLPGRHATGDPDRRYHGDSPITITYCSRTFISPPTPSHLVSTPPTPSHHVSTHPVPSRLPADSTPNSFATHNPCTTADSGVRKATRESIRPI